MYIAPMATAMITPALGSMIGTGISSSIIGELNQQYGGSSGVIFGQPGDPLANQYNNLMQVVSTQLIQTDALLQDTVQSIQNPYRIQAITSEEQLYQTPVSMQLPILMYAPVRQLFEEDRIYGYGFHKECLPKEDVFGRLIHNGSVSFQPTEDQPEVPEYITEEWYSDDPKLSEDDLEAIEATRTWIAQYLRQQLGEQGELRDPTDPSNKIGKRRTKSKP